MGPSLVRPGGAVELTPLEQEDTGQPMPLAMTAPGQTQEKAKWWPIPEQQKNPEIRETQGKWGPGA